MRDIVLSHISVIPFKYDPQTRRLEVYRSININVSGVEQDYNSRQRTMKKSRVFTALKAKAVADKENALMSLDLLENPTHHVENNAINSGRPKLNSQDITIRQESRQKIFSVLEQAV